MCHHFFAATGVLFARVGSIAMDTICTIIVWMDHFQEDTDRCLLSERCSGSKAGSYLRLIDFWYLSTLGLGVIKRKEGAVLEGILIGF